MKEIIKETKGITLIALVVTIIILLILAGVVMAFIIGPNNIIDKAKDATTKYKTAANNEETALNTLSNQLDSGEFSDISAADLATVTKLPQSAQSTQATDKDGKSMYYKDDTALSSLDLTNTTNDTSKVTVSNGKTIDDYKVYYKAATKENLTAGSAAYVNGNLLLGNGADNQKYYNDGYKDGANASTIKTETADISVSANFNESSLENAYGTHTFTPPAGYKLSGAYVLTAVAHVCMSRGVYNSPTISGNTVTAYMTLGAQSNINGTFYGDVTVIVIYTLA